MINKERPWDEVTRAAMDGECELEVVEVAPLYTGQAPDEVVICATHACDWDEDKAIPCLDARRIADAVRTGWDAAINAAAKVVTPICTIEFEGSVTDPNAAAMVGANRALWGASEALRSLLPSTEGDQP